MFLEWLLCYLRLCGYSFEIVVCLTDTGEVVRIAPSDFFGIRYTRRKVAHFARDGSTLVVYLV